MNNTPDCCDKPMEELFNVEHDTVHDESYDVMVGYECKVCKRVIDTNGEEVE